MRAYPTRLITLSAPVGIATCIAPAVSPTYTAEPIVKAGNLASARIIHCRSRVKAPPSVDEVTAIPNILSAVVAASASANSHLLSTEDKYNKSQNAMVAPPVHVTVIPVYLPSAEPAGSRAIEAFSARVILPVIVPPARANFASRAVCNPDVLAIERAESAMAVALPTDVTTPVRLALVASLPLSFCIACRIESVAATVPAPETYPVNTLAITGALVRVVALPTEVTSPVRLALVVTFQAVRPEAVPVQLVNTPLAGVQRAGVVKIGLVSVLFVRVSERARVESVEVEAGKVITALPEPVIAISPQVTVILRGVVPPERSNQSALFVNF